jgi:hypothetical protein
MMTILVLNKNVQLKFFYMGEYPSPDKKILGQLFIALLSTSYE